MNSTESILLFVSVSQKLDDKYYDAYADDYIGKYDYDRATNNSCCDDYKRNQYNRDHRQNSKQAHDKSFLLSGYTIKGKEFIATKYPYDRIPSPISHA